MINSKKSKNSGVTLIALVVTIIVLIILVGIVVATLMGDNGIIKRAGDAKEAQRGATVQDEVTLAIAENEMIDQLNSVNGGQENKKTKTDIVNELVTKGCLTSDDKTRLETEDEIEIGGITIDFSQLAIKNKIKAYLLDGNNDENDLIEIEVDEGTTWQDWADDLLQETDNETVNILGSGIRLIEEKINNLEIDDYDIAIGFRWLSDIDYHVELLVTNDGWDNALITDEIEPEHTYVYFYNLIPVPV